MMAWEVRPSPQTWRSNVKRRVQRIFRACRFGSKGDVSDYIISRLHFGEQKHSALPVAKSENHQDRP
jgi:hypothetical protein